MRIKSYSGDRQGELEIKNLDISEIHGKDILVIEDIFDTGATMKALVEKLQEICQPKSLESFVCLHKRNKKNLHLDFWSKYTGFYFPMKFLIGYGMDWNDVSFLSTF